MAVLPCVCGAFTVCHSQNKPKVSHSLSCTFTILGPECVGLEKGGAAQRALRMLSRLAALGL